MRTTHLVIVLATVATACQIDEPSGYLQDSVPLPIVTAGSGTMMPLEPEMRHMCPEISDISLDQLSLGANTKLLVQPPPLDWEWDEEGLGLYSIGAGSLIPMPVDLLSIDDEVNGHQVQVSPNRQWLLIPRKSLADGVVSQWISSVDGRQQWKLASDQSADIGAWVDDNTVLLGSFVDDSHNPYYFEFLRIVDPFTGESREVRNLPGVFAPGRGWPVFRYRDQVYLLYRAADGYGLRDMFGEKDYKVLEWLSPENLVPNRNGVEVTPDGRIVIRIERPQGVEVSLPVSPLELIGMEYDDFAMGSIVLPASVHATEWGIGRTAVNGEHLYGEGGSFLWYDYSTGEIRDYCIDYHSYAWVSGDGQFAAVGRSYLPSLPPIHFTTWLLDLSTGQRARLEDLYPVAWVQDGP